MNRLPRYLVGLMILAAACTDDTEGPAEPSLALLQAGAARVTTNADAGPGSFRAAVQAANDDASIGTIRFAAGWRRSGCPSRSPTPARRRSSSRARV